MTRRRGRRPKQLLDELKENRVYYRLKGEALACTVWKTRLWRGCGPVRQAAYDIGYDIFVNCYWVVTRWQQYSTHLHTNNT